jgi:hypothetical protein
MKRNLLTGKRCTKMEGAIVVQTLMPGCPIAQITLGQ